MINAELGTPVSQAQLAETVKAKQYKVVTVTHVDTSTGEFSLNLGSNLNQTLLSGVLSDIKAVAATVKRVSPQTLVCLL